MSERQADPNTVYLDDFPLPDGTWLAGEGSVADPILATIGLYGPLYEQQEAPVTLGSEGLQIEIWPCDAPADSRNLPDILKSVIWDTDSAVLHLCDAAALPGFDGPDALPGLEVSCLFDPPAADTLAEAAPYLVELDPEHWHSAHLFDDTGANWSHWPRATGIFLHSQAPMPEIRGNLRRFTKLRDGDAWVYLRLAEPRHLMPLLLGLSPGQRGRLFTGLEAMIAIDPDDGFILRASCTDPATPERIEMTPVLRATLEASSVARFAGEAERFCRDGMVDKPVPDEPRRFCRIALATAQAANMHDRQAVLFSIAAAWCAGDPKWVRQQGDIVGNPAVTQIEQGRALLRRAYDLGSHSPVARHAS